ncbi:MAG: dihydropteroate synthase [Pseudomonadota bacterium]
MLNLSFPAVMGILNVTPDSFSDGGLFVEPAAALAHARRMISAGADLIDIGGESTRPGAAAVSVDVELERTVPLVRAIRKESDVPLSIDTSSPEVMREAASAGVDLINDVRALQRKGALAAAAETGLPVCLMHMQGQPATMQQNPHYSDLVAEIKAFFQARIAACEAAGIDRSRLLLDPGFGFGKTPAQNLRLINQLDTFTSFGLPILVGLSRKSTIGEVLGDPDEDRKYGSIAGAVMAVARGASIVRVHDVAETVQAIAVARAIMAESVNRRKNERA